MNQSSKRHVADAKQQGKPNVTDPWMGLVLLLTRWKSGVRFLIQSCSMVDAKPITLRHLNEKHSNDCWYIPQKWIVVSAHSDWLARRWIASTTPEQTEKNKMASCFASVTEKQILSINETDYSACVVFAARYTFPTIHLHFIIKICQRITVLTLVKIRAHLEILQPAAEWVHLWLKPIFDLLPMILHPIYTSPDVLQGFLRRPQRL